MSATLGEEMAVSLQSVGAITLFVEDSQRSKSFYERVFGVPAAYEYEDAAGFKLENTIVNLLTIPAAHVLIDPAPVAEPGDGSRFQLTIWVDDADALLVWGDDKENHTRCGICGSLLYSVVRDGAYVHVAMGSLADEPTIRPTEHIFVGSKAPWFEISDDLPQAEEY